RTFLMVLFAGALDLAGVLPDQPVRHGGVQDGPHQPVRLGNLPSARLAPESRRVPAPDVGRPDLVQVHVTEGRGKVEPEQVLIGPPGLPGQVAVLHPFGRVLSEGDRPGFRVEPVALGDLGILELEPALRGLLRVERLGRRAESSVRPSVPRLVAARRQLADIAEVALLLAGHHAALPVCRRTGSTVPAAMNSSNADSGMRTYRPILTKVIRRSSIRRRG